MVASWTHNCMVTQVSPTSSESFLGLFVLYMGPFFDVLSSQSTRTIVIFAKWNEIFNLQSIPHHAVDNFKQEGSYHAHKTIFHIRNWTKRIDFFTFIHII